MTVDRQQSSLLSYHKIFVVSLLFLGGTLIGLLTAFNYLHPGYKTINGVSHANSCAAAEGTVSGNGSTPPLYLGLRAYEHWDKLSYLQYGIRTDGESSADPGGSNTDNIHTLGKVNNGYMLFNQTGPGLLTFMRNQETIGSPWDLYLDSMYVHIAAGDFGQYASDVSPANMFLYPLSLNPNEDQGSSILSTDIPFTKNLTWQSESTNGNFYTIYYKLPYGSSLPAFNNQVTSTNAINFLTCAGSDIAPANIPEQTGIMNLNGNQSSTLTTLKGPSQIRALQFHVPYNEKVRFGNSTIQIYWDNETTPSVNVPIKFLAGDGAGIYQPANRPLVKGILANITGDGSTYMDFTYYYPMPFASNARIVVTSTTPSTLTGISWSVRSEPFPDPQGWWGKFHATYTDISNPVQGQDMTFLNTDGSGRLVGTIVNFGSVGGTLEGDPHIYIDNSKTAQIAVTGTEEWGLGGDYWNHGVQTSLPLGGLPSSTNNPSGQDVDGAALYRFLIADSISFNSHLTVNWEHGGGDQTTNRYRAAILWYGTPVQTAVLSDTLLTGSQASRSSHAYTSADSIYSLTSGYEYTVHTQVNTADVATTNKSVSFVLSVDPRNQGTYLRRTFDYCTPNQTATVLVNNQPAGTWFSAGSSTKNGVDGNARCWRDEDFPLPPVLTAGQSSIVITLTFMKTNTPPDSAWTAASYALYNFIPPQVQNANFTPTPTVTPPDSPVASPSPSAALTVVTQPSGGSNGQHLQVVGSNGKPLSDTPVIVTGSNTPTGKEAGVTGSSRYSLPTLPSNANALKGTSDTVIFIIVASILFLTSALAGYFLWREFHSKNKH